MPEAKIGVIGGTGLYDIEGMTDIEEVNIDTPFGPPSDSITIGKLEGVGVAFLPRHGKGHRISPTELPSRPISMPSNHWVRSTLSLFARRAASSRR